MSPDSINEWAGAGVALAAVAAAVYGFFKWVRPKYRKAKAVGTEAVLNLVGDGPLVDPVTGRELRPAVPGIGKRVALIETDRIEDRADLSALTKAVASLAESVRKMVGELDGRMTAVEARLRASEVAAAGLIVSAAQATEVLRSENNKHDDAVRVQAEVHLHDTGDAA